MQACSLSLDLPLVVFYLCIKNKHTQSEHLIYTKLIEH